MQRITSAVAILALFGSGTAQAANDMGLTLHQGAHTSVSTSGVGAQANLTIRLGDRRVVRSSEKVMLGVAAGPILSTPAHHSIAGDRRAAAGIASFSFKPGYSSTLSIAGQQILQNYTPLGAADADAQNEGTSKPKKKQSTGDKVAWVAAVAGGVMVVLVGVAAIVLMTDCYECGD